MPGCAGASPSVPRCFRFRRSPGEAPARAPGREGCVPRGKGRGGPAFAVDGPQPERSPWGRTERSWHHRALGCHTPSQTPALPSMACPPPPSHGRSQRWTEGRPPSSSASPPRAAGRPVREARSLQTPSSALPPGRKNFFWNQSLSSASLPSEGQSHDFFFILKFFSTMKQGRIQLSLVDVSLSS